MADPAHSPIAFLAEPIVFLAAAVVAVPLARRLGLGSVLGYLAAGLAIGPFALGLLGEAGRVMAVAELGIVLLLFVVGLELRLTRLWELRRDIFGLGTAQVVVCGVLLMIYPLFIAGRPLKASVVAGLGLALSSTALAMQLMEERGERDTPHGRVTFSVLLLQDLAIVPLLALVAFLAPGDDGEAGGWRGVLAAVGAVAAVILAGRYLLDPLFRILARTGAREVMTAAALLVVLGAAALMSLVGLSMAMGAFLAGVLLAESSYRHELEADIEPFRGLLLGLFFISVGMSVDLTVVGANWAGLLAAVTVLVAIKTAAFYGLARLFRHGHDDALRAALLLAQGGEFGFVLYAAAASAGVMGQDHASLLVALVTISMALTPFVVRFGQRFLCGDQRVAPEEDFSDATGSVLVIGFGRFGQLASQVLLARGHELTIIDSDVNRIEEAKRFGRRIHYGDGTRVEVLRAAGAECATLVAICTDGAETTNRIVEMAQAALPGTPLLVRSYDRRHALELIRRDVAGQVRETFESALAFGREALMILGDGREAARSVEEEVRRRDAERLRAQVQGGLHAGLDPATVRPEPLVPPRPQPARQAAPVVGGGG